MKALVVGQGGREHALARALKNSPSISAVHAVPGSEGMAADATPHAIDWRDTQAMLDLIRSAGIDFVVVGPEVPLVDGLSDRLRAAGVAVFGPSGEAARLEGSKIFCKEFLRSAGVPTARAEVVTTVAETLAAARLYQPPYVLKADGLAAGKGVFICKTLEELADAARSIFEQKTLGEAGSRALLEEFSPGYEISYLILTNGESFEALPLAQDHKRLSDGDTGPNTGGMGVVAPVPLAAELHARLDREVVVPTLREMQRRGLLYRGVLFIGLMMTDEGPSVLEFNTRFGDPETQALMPLLDGDWGKVMSELSGGRLEPLKWSSCSTCCVVLAAEGYPDHPVKGAEIAELPTASAERYLLHAGTKADGRGWRTAGGRVLNAIGVGSTLREAVNNAYAIAHGVKSPALRMRADIGAKVLD